MKYTLGGFLGKFSNNILNLNLASLKIPYLTNITPCQTVLILVLLSIAFTCGMTYIPKLAEYSSKSLLGYYLFTIRT